MKVDTIIYLTNILKQDQQKLHKEFVDSVNLCFDPITRKLNITQQEYSKLNDTLYLGYRKRYEQLNGMIKELNNLLPKS
jgi:hypothetical protein